MGHICPTGRSSVKVRFGEPSQEGRMQGRPQDLAGRGGQEFFFRFGNLHVAKRRHAANGEAMLFARGPFGGMPPPPKNFF